MAMAMAMAETLPMAAGRSKACVRASLFEQHAFVRLLELHAGTPSALKIGSSPSLALINGVVTPDLPIDATLVEYLNTFNMKTLQKSLKQLIAKEETEKATPVATQVGISSGMQGFNCWQVKTVAAQMRSEPEICERIIKSAREIEEGECGGSLLLLSGGHPVRKIWLANHLLPTNSFSMLRAAQGLRKAGIISPGSKWMTFIIDAHLVKYVLFVQGVQLWSVENPLINHVNRLEKKIEAGAEAVIVQPPLLPDCFAQWWTKAQERGLTKEVPVVVGLPLLSSSRNYLFWLQLTGASGKEADAILSQWRRAEAEHAGDPGAMAAFCNQQSMKLIETIKRLPGVAGIHIMPVTRAGWRLYEGLSSEGRL